MTKKTVEILNFQRWIERKGWKEKEREKKEQALKQRSVHFQTSLTRFHVFHREINPDEAGNSAPTQRQRTATFNVKIFHGGRIFSFLFFSVDPKRDLGQWRAISSRLSLWSVPPASCVFCRPKCFLFLRIVSETLFNYRTVRRVEKPVSLSLSRVFSPSVTLLIPKGVQSRENHSG